MKKATIVFAAMVLLFLPLSAQDLYRMENVATGNLISFDNGDLQSNSGSENSDGNLWQLIDTGGGDFRIRNVRSGDYLHIEQGPLACTPIEMPWHSALWNFYEADGINTYQIGNKWKPGRFINTERGLACTEIMEGWQSASWIMKPAGSSAAATTDAGSETGVPGDHQVFLEKINAFRRAKGLDPVKFDTELNKAAGRHSRDMAEHDRMNHEGSDGSSFSDRIRGTAYSGFGRMENIAMNWSGKAEEFFTQWENSSGHNKNMSLPDISSIGYAVVKRSSGEYYATLVGGRD